MALRTKEFQKGDISGHWRLTDPRAKNCELILYGQVTLTASCVSLGAPITRLLKAELADGKLRLLSADNRALLIFDTSNPDSLDGVAPSHGTDYWLDRLEPRTLPLNLLEGMWELRAENMSCDLFLSMRRRRLDDQKIDVVTPFGVAVLSGCVSATDPGVFRFSRSREQGAAIEGGRRTRFFIQEPLNIRYLPVGGMRCSIWCFRTPPVARPSSRGRRDYVWQAKRHRRQAGLITASAEKGLTPNRLSRRR